MAKSDSSSGWQLKTSPDTGPHTFAVAITASGGTRVQRYSRTVRSLNTWYHVAGVYNASAKTLDIYVNGNLDNGVLRGTIPSAQVNSSVNANMGQRSGGFYFRGTIDEVRIYNRASTQAEVQTDMNTAISNQVLSDPTTLTLVAPDEQTTVAGETISFPVEAVDPNGAAVDVSAAQLPDNAMFDAATGKFTWEPGSTRVGDYTVRFTATNAAGESATRTVDLHVVPAQPAIDKLLHAATRESGDVCSPGAIVILQGIGLGQSQSGDEIRVSINGQDLSAIRKSATELAVQCPNDPAGTPLSIQVHRGVRSSDNLETVMKEALPGLFPLEEVGSPQGGNQTLDLLATGLGDPAS